MSAMSQVFNTRDPRWSGEYKSWYWSCGIKDGDWASVLKHSTNLIPWDIYWLMSGPLSGIAEYPTQNDARDALRHGCERYDRGERLDDLEANP